MIEIRDLTKTYGGGVTALRDLNLEIGTGMFGLLGPNGAGKTTLMRILAGLLRPTHGRVSVLGHDMSTAAGRQAVKAQLGYLPQELGLFPNLTGAELLDYVAIMKGVTSGTARRRQVEKVLTAVRLTHAAAQRIKTYSGGMKRRLGIAQALLAEPKLLIVDEPTAGLDPEERVRLRNLLAEMAVNCTIILSTHIVEDINHSCRDLAVIERGRVLFHGSPRELIGRARGETWLVTTAGERPNGQVSIVSTLQTATGVEYRVLGRPEAHLAARAAEPSLEDGYIWLMRQQEQREIV